MKMDGKEARKMLLSVAGMFQEKRDELARLDSVIGDGDHGISMARGARAAYKSVAGMSEQEPINEYFKVYGRCLVAQIGGAMGPLFGMIFTEFGKCLKGQEQLTPEVFAEALENSKEKVMEFGGAKANDKTMADAMIPASEAARKAAELGQSLEETARAAASGAKKGAEQTIEMRARRGRSRFLQEKSIGHQDAGATSYYFLLQCMADYISGDSRLIICEGEEETSEERRPDAKHRIISKFINNPEDIVEETVRGYVKAYGGRIRKIPGCDVVARKKMTKDKVGVIIGNGSGHEPACLGFVGENMLDANAYGGIFAAPGPYTILEAIKAADTGRGVCVLVSAHSGDILNSKMAIDMAEDDGLKAKAVLLYDDIASAPKSEPVSQRRGAVGTLFNYKMTPAYAEGHTLEETADFAARVRDNTRSISAAMSPGTSPITGEPMFQLNPGEVLVGPGVHGEAALMTYRNKKCSEIAEAMIESLVEDRPYEKEDEVAVIVNGSGGTTMMELMIFYTSVEKYLTNRGIRIYKPLIGSYITTQEMGGIGLAICKLDDEMKKCWIRHTDAPHFPDL